MRDIILKTMAEVMRETGGELICPVLDETVLLDSGMDSLGFAILVARLEEDLGFDPFVEMDEPYYPVTFADFVAVYTNRKAN